MTLTLELPTDLTNRLLREVDRRGVVAEECAVQLLNENLPPERTNTSRIEAAVARAQDLVGRYVPKGVNLADELIAERRAEARRE